LALPLQPLLRASKTEQKVICGRKSKREIKTYAHAAAMLQAWWDYMQFNKLVAASAAVVVLLESTSRKKSEAFSQL